MRIQLKSFSLNLESWGFQILPLGISYLEEDIGSLEGSDEGVLVCSVVGFFSFK